MKKTLILILVLILALSIFSTLAYAEDAEINLSDYSTDELIALLISVRTELTNRLNLVDTNDLIGRSTYVVGTDIKRGNYVLTIYETDYRERSDGSVVPNNYITIYNFDEDGNEEEIMWEEDISIGEHLVISIAEGQTLEISGCVCSMALTNSSWSP